MSRIQREQRVIAAFRAGQVLTVREVAIMAQITYQGARRMIDRLGDVVPLCEERTSWPRRYRSITE